MITVCETCHGDGGFFLPSTAPESAVSHWQTCPDCQGWGVVRIARESAND